MEDKTYIAVFFDVDLPALPNEARQIQLDKKRYKSLMAEAMPGNKNVELTDRYGVVGEYSVISRRIFHLKKPNIDFLILDVKNKSCDSEFKIWLSGQKGVEKINNFLYRFFYNEKWCVGQITITPYFEELTIRPNLNTHDIGNGPGAPVYKKFNRIVK